MRLVFMGTPEFARACLEKLHSDGFDIAAVYTKIDTPKNRGMKLIPSPVKEYAQSVGLPVYQPQSFRDEETVQQLRELKPDLLVVVAYGKNSAAGRAGYPEIRRDQYARQHPAAASRLRARAALHPEPLR